jgi:hypothetical protein
MTTRIKLKIQRVVIAAVFGWNGFALSLSKAAARFVVKSPRLFTIPMAEFNAMKGPEQARFILSGGRAE